MPHLHRRRFPVLVPLAAATTVAALGLSGLPQAVAAPAPSPIDPAAGGLRAGDRKADYDARDILPERRAAALQQARPDAAQAERKLHRSLGPQAVVDLDPVTGTPAMIGRLDGFLTGASSAPARTVARRYLRSNAATLGLTASDLTTLTLRRDYVDVAGIHHLSWTQSVRGIPVFGNGVKANVTKRGQLISVQGSPVSDLAGKAAAADASPDLSAGQAREAAATDVGGKASDARPVAGGRKARWANHDRASLVWFAGPGGLRLGWSTYVQAGGSLAF